MWRLEAEDTPLEITARSDDGEIMGLRHRQHPTFGVQFHPESILTEHGYAMLRNFLKVVTLSAVWFNGQFVDGPCRSIPSDRGLLLGDGVFETVLSSTTSPCGLMSICSAWQHAAP